MLVDFVAEHLVEQSVELAEVAEDHVPSEIPGETLRVDDGPGLASGNGLALVDLPARESEPLQLASARKPRMAPRRRWRFARRAPRSWSGQECRLGRRGDPDRPRS